MKKLFFTVVLLAAGSAMSFAQKAVVYCDDFKFRSDIGLAAATQLRSLVLSSVSETGRVNIIDGADEQMLQDEALRRAKEEAMSDATARTTLMKQLGADYILSGVFTQLVFEQKQYSDGSVYYDASGSYSLKVTKSEDGTLLASKDFALGGLMAASTGATKDEAYATVLKVVGKQVRDFVDDNFKLRAVIIGEDYEVKKNSITKCYATIGSDHGVSKGQALDVAVIKVVAGRETEKVIGELKVEEVVAGDLSLCKVSKGGAEIFKAMKEYLDIKATDPDHARELVVITKKKKTSVGEGVGTFFGF